MRFAAPGAFSAILKYMETINIESIVFYILLIDAIGANLLAWSGGQHWWKQNLAPLSRFMPLARGWTTYYFIIVVVMGIMLCRAGVLVLPF